MALREELGAAEATTAHQTMFSRAMVAVSVGFVGVIRWSVPVMRRRARLVLHVAANFNSWRVTVERVAREKLRRDNRDLEGDSEERSLLHVSNLTQCNCSQAVDL